MSSLIDCDSIKVEICARPNALRDMDLAVSVAGDVQEWLEKYLNFSYPLPKMGKISLCKHRSNRYL